MSYTARFQFQADRAHEFIDDGRLVTEMDFDDVQDIILVCGEFEDALEDVNVFCHTSGKVINLSDFTYSI